jgi:broad specificity phosphatase PhoE
MAGGRGWSLAVDSSTSVRPAEPVVLVARHGQTPFNAEKRILGRRDPSLDEVGNEQAKALGVAIAGQDLAAVWTSPLRRASETAASAGVALGVTPRPLDGLLESDRGRWEGRRVSDIVAAEPELFEAFLAGAHDFEFPGGESLAAQAARTKEALETILSGPVPALVVAHAGTIRALMSLAEEKVPPESSLANGEVALRLRPEPAPTHS